MENLEGLIESKSWKVNINPMTKSIRNQLILFVLWSIIIVGIVFYVSYLESRLDLIHLNRLPYNLIWLPWVCAGLFVGSGFYLYYTPTSFEYTIKQEILHNGNKILQDAQNLSGEQKYSEAKTIIEDYFLKTRKFNIRFDKKPFLKILQISGQNIGLKNQITTMQNFIEKNHLKEARDLFFKLRVYINQNYRQLDPALIDTFDLLYPQIQ
ncbi:MAG: hypothetical protein ACTSVU_01085 [Promethearchaeota archaeon]